MRRLLATLTVAFALLLGLPAVSSATAAEPLGGGAILFDPLGTTQCTASFAAVRGGDWYLITGPACANASSALLYSGDMTPVGTVVATGQVYAIVHVTNTTDWELVPWIKVGGVEAVIGGSTETPVGGSVCLIDHALGFQCGTVVAVNETVNFPSGPVTGLTRTNVCASPRAVAFISGDQAQGVPAGGSGHCTTAGTSWFKPVNPILRAHDLTLLTG